MMRHHRIGGSFLRGTGLLLGCALLSGCMTIQITQEYEPQPDAVPVAKPKPVQKAKAKPVPATKSPKVARSAKPEPEQQAKIEPTTQPAAPLKPTGAQVLPRVAILVSDDIPAYMTVSDTLAVSLKARAKVYHLNGDPIASADVIDQIQRSDRAQVVAIGLLAAKSARKLSGKQVVFCQVFNYQDYDLVTPWMKGVSMVPQLSGLFSMWKALDPSLQQIGVITGKNHEAIVNQARAAAEPYGIGVIHRVVGSDKETLYAFKGLASEIQGLWLLPDNRVLSRRVIRTIMSYSVKQGKQVLVFHPQLFKVGGLISVASRDTDIATQVLTRLQQAHGKQNVPGPDVAPLTKTELQINPVMVQRLGLVIPQYYMQLSYKP